MTADDTRCLHSSHVHVIKWTIGLPVARQGVVAPNFQVDSDVMNRQGQAGWVGLYKLRKNASGNDFRRDVYSKSANHSQVTASLRRGIDGLTKWWGTGRKKKWYATKTNKTFFLLSDKMDL